MKKLYYRFLLLLIEKPIYNLIIIVGIFSILQIISIKIVLADEYYYHPLMGEKVIQQEINENNTIILPKEYLKKDFFYEEAKKVFHLRMFNHVRILRNSYYTQINLEDLDPKIILAYEEIVRKFHHFYLENPNPQDMAKECIHFCKIHIPANLWGSQAIIGNLNTTFMLLTTRLKSPEQIGETLFLHAVMTCYNGYKLNLFQNNDLLYSIFLQKLSTVQFNKFLTNPFVKI